MNLSIRFASKAGSGMMALLALSIASVVYGTPDGFFDGISPTSAVLGDTLSGNGWAVDTITGAPVQRVEVRVDGNTVLNATLGGQRGDVANAYGRSDYLYSGWNFSYAASNLAAGSHTFSAWAFNSSGESAQLNNTFTVTVAANRAPSSSLSSSSTNITQGQSITLTSTITDPDNNLSNQAVDYSTDNVNYTSGWNNWSGQTAWNFSGGSSTNTVTYTPPSAGTYYFRSRGQDATGALSNFVYVTVTVTAANHAPQVHWASGSNTYPGGTTTLQGNVTDQDNNLQTAYFYINPPSRSGWQYVGAVGISGGNATPSLNYAFPSNAAWGTWLVTMRVIDSSGTWDPDTNDQGSFTVNTSPSSQLTVSPTSGFTAGQSITLTSTITDPDGNLSNQAVDFSTDNSTWTSGWNNWSGTTGWSVSGSSATNTITYAPPNAGYYYFRSRGQDSVGALSGFATVTIYVGTALSAPSITQQPSSQTVNAGTTVSFTVSASGNPSPSYQWRKNGTNLANIGNISGATGTTLTIASAQSSDAAQYACYVSNSSGNVTSNSATLSVTTSPSITSPLSTSGAAGSTISYTITATNTPSSYSATGLPAGLALNTSTGVITGSPAIAGSYSCTIGATNSAGTGYATLTINIGGATTPLPLGLNIHRPGN